MKRIIFILLIMISKLSFASFPVSREIKIDENVSPELTSIQIILFVAIIVNIFRIRRNIKTYGTIYKPLSAYSEDQRIFMRLLLILSVILIILGAAIILNPNFNT